MYAFQSDAVRTAAAWLLRPRLGRGIWRAGLGCGMLLLLGVVVGGAADGPKGKGKLKPISPSQLQAMDGKAEKLQSSFIRETMSLAAEYEQAGQFERAQSLYEAVSRVSPDLPGLNEKLTALQEQLLDGSEVKFELDVSRNWTHTGLMAREKTTCRVEAQGQYKFAVEVPCDALGLATADPANDLVSGIPVGALMGVIVVNNKPGKPFVIVPGKPFEAPGSGPLILKVNVPRGHQSTGSLDLVLAGFYRSLN